MATTGRKKVEPNTPISAHRRPDRGRLTINGALVVRAGEDASVAVAGQD